MTKGSRRSNSRQPDYEDELAGTSQSGNGGMMLHLTEGLIPKFTSQEKTYPATRWVQDVEDNADLCGWTPLQQLLMARRSLAGTALLWFRAGRVFKTWEEFKAGILKEFPDNIDAKAIHEMMSARHKKHDESCLEYMFVMKELGKRGKIPDYVAIKYIIEGIKDQEVNKIMLYGVTAYSELKEKLKIYEQLKANIASSSREASRHKHPEETYGRAVTRCYSCGEENHPSADCPHKERGLKCFKCNQFGHIASQCESLGTGTVTATTSRFKNDVSTAANGDVGNTVRRWSSDAGGAGIAAKRNFYGSSDNTIQDDAIGGSNKMAHHCLTTMTTVRSDTKINNNERSISTNKPIKQVTVFKSNVLALVDSGSEVNLLAYECYKQLNAPELDKSEILLSGLGANKVKCYGRIELNIMIDEQWYNDVLFYVIPTKAMPYSMILGQDLLRNCILVMESNNVKLKPAAGSEVSPDTEQKVKDLVEPCAPRKTKEAPVKLKMVLKDDIPVVQQPRRLAPAAQTEVSQQVTQWYLPDRQVPRCINSTYQHCINTSPVDLLTGTKMKLKEDNEIYALSEQENRESYVLKREENRRSLKEQILKVQEENRHSYNRKRKDSTKYQEGDLVAIKRTQFEVGMKMKPKYPGPYQVDEATGRNRYRRQKVDDSTEGSRNTTPSCNHMKPWPINTE